MFGLKHTVIKTAVQSSKFHIAPQKQPFTCCVWFLQFCLPSEIFDSLTKWCRIPSHLCAYY